MPRTEACNVLDYYIGIRCTKPKGHEGLHENEKHRLSWRGMAELDLPKIEFEGPLGKFYPLNSVPIEALVKGIRELFSEATKRGYKRGYN